MNKDYDKKSSGCVAWLFIAGLLGALQLIINSLL